MTDRAILLKEFVNQTIWRDWAWVSVTDDASNRRYWRLCHEGRAVIVMDDDPAHGGSTKAFAEIAALLLSEQLQVPHILAHDSDQGFMIISDLGPTDMAAWLRRNPNDEKRLYQSATDVLIKLHHIAAPPNLTAMTARHGADMIGFVGEFYSQNDVGDLIGQMQAALAAHAPEANTLALRDFHAENLIWRDAHDGIDRIGLLDFQDAFRAPAGYDRVSLLTDARRDVSPAVADEMKTYFMKTIGAGPDFTAQLACLGVQRNLRILGIFGRLSLHFGKSKYLDLIPRVWGHIENDLSHPALGTLRQAAMDSVPAPTPALLESLRP